MTTKITVVLVALFGQVVFAYYHGHHDDQHAAAPYHFEYDVKDSHTHDIKSQYEESDGHGNVKGTYSLVEPDGSTRLVEYTADHEHGFNAVVKKIDAPGHYHQGGGGGGGGDYHGYHGHLEHYPSKQSSNSYKFY